MCGINGLVFLKGVKRSETTMAKVRYVFGELMVETQDRGEHATGLASFRRDGSYEFHKNNTNAEKMTTDDKKYQEIVANFDPELTSVVIAHTRYLTKGVATNMNNNHPFDIGNVVGLHNGSAKNDDELFKLYEKEFKRVGQVDSEIVFQLINFYNPNSITLEGLRVALEDTRLRGLFALAFVHKNQPNLLHLIKQDKPMHLAYWKEAGIIIFNSDKDYIVNAFRKLERIGQTFSVEGMKEEIKYEWVMSDRYFTVDANANTYAEAVGKEHKFFIETTAYTYTGGSSKSTTTTNKTTSSSGTSNLVSDFEKVTAKDSKGLVLQGEVCKKTGEVIIWSEDITSADDGSGLVDEEEVCFECQEWLLEEDVQAPFNASNPEHERFCKACYTEIMEMMIPDAEKEEQLDCDGHKVG